jgi:hypothetical protein
MNTVEKLEHDAIETIAGQAALFKRCMGALGIYPAHVWLGSDIISKRRWRRFEQGKNTLPPRAWDMLAATLEREKYHYLLSLVNRVRQNHGHPLA